MTEPVVVCVHCGARLFICKAIGMEFSGSPVKAKDFIPLDDSIPQPKDGDRMLCPKCNEEYVERASKEGGVLLQLEGNAWWPHPPLQPEDS